MGFRERPEYQDWRDAVLRLFGQKCIRCGYAGNIHAHHVMPVNEYPELVFEPTNGVPLCGNCHTEIKGNELAHVDDLKRLQRAVLGGATAGVASDGFNENGLRERAYAEPSNAAAVEQWFMGSHDSQAVVDFYSRYPDDSTRTAWLCFCLCNHTMEREQWSDTIEVAEKAISCAEREGKLESLVEGLALYKSSALDSLGRFSESAAFLREVLARFPDAAALHHSLSISLARASSRAAKDMGEAQEPIEESVRHALKAAQLDPGEFYFACQASSSLTKKGDYASALRHGKRALALASNDKEKVCALDKIAAVYIVNELYADARRCLSEALEIDEFNVSAVATMGVCHLLEGNRREALRMANRGMMLDPRNERCQDICNRLRTAH